jgi:YidC/Oxa1 family membrane protein insertase
MDNDAKGCLSVLGVIILGILIGVILRGQNITQILVMGGIVLLTVFLIFVCLLCLIGIEGDEAKLIGVLAGIESIILAVSIGGFLITGNYQWSLNVALFKWGTSNESQASVVEATATALPSPTAMPTFTPTPVPTPVFEENFDPGTLETGGIVARWLTMDDIPPDEVTLALNTIWSLSAPQALGEAEAIRNLWNAARHGKNLPAFQFLIAVAYERGGDFDSAQKTYTAIAQQYDDTPYGPSAAFRSRLLESPAGSSKEQEALFQSWAEEPEMPGWFLFSGTWANSTSRKAALGLVMSLRADWLWVRLFEFIRERSTFPTPYTYLFLLLVITVGVKILEFPLILNTTKTMKKLQSLQPQIQALQQIYSENQAEQQSALYSLYKENNINVWGGCLTSIIDWIFVIWAMVSMGNYVPQIIIDGGNFLWINDVTKFNLWIVIALYLITWLGMWLSGSVNQMAQQMAQSQDVSKEMSLSCSFVGLFAVLLAVSWILKWPAYVFIFWSLLTILGVILNGIMNLIVSLQR